VVAQAASRSTAAESANAKRIARVCAKRRVACCLFRSDASHAR
jgi:hypothetical protein